jgi:Pilus formation protein N terminal region
MDSDSQRAQNKKSLLSIGVLMLSLAALQSPLWRAQQAVVQVAVRSGGAALLATDRPIAEVRMEQNQQATAELVGDREVLIKGKALGEARLTISSKDGHTSNYRVTVRAESAQSGPGAWTAH